MANYYNLRAWKRTGFDRMNRPYDRSVLTQSYFTDPSKYIQLKGIVVKRDDMSGLAYIDLQGSVKDIKGEQVNAPNATGPQGPGGPWYSWEEVDYVCLVRTGYPNDEDYVDVSGNVLDPWEIDVTGGKLFISYYFVTGLTPIARNVTRVWLEEDYWLTMGGASELEIETGFKVRGHITEAEDAAEYNTAAEPIGLIHPLETIAHETLEIPETGTDIANNEFLVSSVDLLANSEDDNIAALTVTTSDGASYAIPKIQAATRAQNLALREPGGNISYYAMSGQGVYNPANSKVLFNLTSLYSAGQLELQDSYIVPKKYLNQAQDVGGAYTVMMNAVHEIVPKIAPDISEYPRKADYMFGQLVLYSDSVGTMDIENFSEVSDRTVQVWALIGASGTPYARFKTIKEHPYLYDKAIQGMPWVKKAITLQGASGSLWTQINSEMAQASNALAQANIDLANASADIQYKRNDPLGLQGTGNIITQAVAAGVSGQTPPGAALKIAGSPFDYYNYQKDRELQLEARRFTQSAQDLKIAQTRQDYMRNMTGQPYVSFTPDISRCLFSDNGFNVYIVNSGAADRARLRHYFRRYGYSGLYTPLTWETINVKNKVNFIQAEGVVLKHHHYPMRDVQQTAALLEQGLFLWHERPNAAAFETNADN